METRTVLQCDMVKVCMSFNILYFHTHVPCFSELCRKFRISSSNIVGEIAETRTAQKSGMYGQGKNCMSLPTSWRGA